MPPKSLDIESILYDIGITVIRESGDELVAKCPGHQARTGKEDAHPSWSINAKTYAHYCFSCGYSGTLTTLYQEMVGEVPEDLEWELSKRSVILSLVKEERAEEVPEGPSVDEWTLSQYTDVPDRLLERRGLLRASVDHFGVRWDSVAKTWVIPIRTPDGDLMGFQFRQKGQVINHPTGMEKATTLFGLNLFKHQSDITVVESPLDAVRFMNVGVTAVSTFGAGVSDEQVTLLARNFRMIISAMDNDAPGQRATEYMRSVLRRRGSVVIPFDYTGLQVKDPGDIKWDANLRDAWEKSILLQTG